LPALSGDQYAELMKGKPLLVDAKYPMPARLLLPLPDGSGDVLMHELSEIERQAWAETRCATGLQALCLLVQTTAKALREVHPASHLRGIVSDAIKQASEAPRFAAGSPGGRWLAAFTAPAAAAAAGNWDALAEDELAKREQALKLACGRLKDGLDEALAVVQAWHSDPAVDALVRSFEAVVGLVDSRKNFADAAQLLQHADAGPTRFQLYQAIDHLDRFVRRWRLTPEQRKALLDVRGNAHESLVTWADRLDSAGATALAT
jgi:hypothetical protein